MTNSRTLAAGGLVGSLVVGVLTNVLSDRLKFLWSSSDAATPVQHSPVAVERPAAAEQPSSFPVPPRAEPPRPAPTRNRSEKSIQDKSTTIDDEDGG